ncbi:SiaB family protein kinase [Brumimicrobium oceani]|uniref:Histidine kinase/HSP90-like ATPase domain-containing protein n=1 Tax=Brumimicrobium oceani TaxID=2100725 RepID=A0A2U2XGB0_9FLAO|nr:SiaB family protein kinase [Brumimicrobium oceani]PWH86825.1 hypothetical protein DIT68_00760 [Brumimicrobium oceani]
MNRSNETQIDAHSIYNELNKEFTEFGSKKLIMSHFGEFSQDLVNSLSEGLELILDEKGVPRIVIKRMFSVMIEGLQNIRLHGIKNKGNRQLGHVMIAEKNGSYSVSFGNIIDEDGELILVKYLTKLNKMDLSEQKEYYLNILGNGDMTSKGGAGLGFTTIALKSKSKIEFQFVDYEEDTSYLEMRVEII